MLKMVRRTIQRTTSFMLVLLMLIHITPYKATFAEVKDDIAVVAADILSVVLETPEYYGIEIGDANYKITEAITPYTYNEYGVLMPLEDTKYYFIYYGNTPVATLISNNSVTGVFFETDTAKQAAEFENIAFTILCDTNGAYICSSVYNTNPTASLRDININASTLTYSSNTIPESYYINVPIVQQFNDNTCWAACVASVGSYFKGIDKTARQVCDQMGIDYNLGASPIQIVNGVRQLYNLNAYQFGGWTTIDGIYDFLSNGVVPIALFQSNIWGGGIIQGHSVVIRGYRASQQSTFAMVMDPNYSSYCVVYAKNNPDGQFSLSFTYGTNEFYWIDTVLASN